MSIEAVMSRVSQLQAMLASGSPQPARDDRDRPSSTSFSSALQNATTRATPTAFASLATGATADHRGERPSRPARASRPARPTPPRSPPPRPPTASIPALLAGLVKQESGFNPNAGSGAGARGLTQLMPSTAAGLGVSNVLDPVQSLNGGAKYLKQQLDTFGGDVTKALAAYNAGPGAVQRFGGVPPYSETQNYVRIVQANAAAYRAGTATTPSPSTAAPRPLPPRSRGP